MRTYIISLLLLCLHMSVTGQTKLGVSGGGTLAGFNYQEDIPNTDYKDESKLGLNGGIKVDIQLGKQKVIKLTPEIFINQNGTKDEYYTTYMSFVDSFSQNKVALDYVGLYLPLKINIQSATGEGLYLMGAFYADYTINASVQSNKGTSEKVEFTETKDRVDYGYRLSLGVLFTEHVGLEFGYNKGISNIEFNTKLNATQTNYLINNKGFTISLVALF